ncbi:MAG: hypothetical protein EXR11_10720 [Rhodospirillaceae bacterium]|nr:hypothetical protein [Rhodospirillaceae bacterium]
MLDSLRQPWSKFWLFCLLIYIAAQSCVRIVLSLIAGFDDPSLLSMLAAAIPLGLVNDAAMAVLLSLPFAAGLYLFPALWRRPLWTKAAHGLFFVLLMVLVFDQVAAVIFWNEFDSRFNAIAVNYLIFPREVIGTISETFDMRILIPVPVVALLIHATVFRHLNNALTAPALDNSVVQSAVVAVTMALLAGLTVWAGPFSPGGSREVTEIAANGMERLLTAAITNNQGYAGLYLSMDDTQALSRARSAVAQDNTQFITPNASRSLMRHVTPSQPEKNSTSSWVWKSRLAASMSIQPTTLAVL